MCEYQRVELDKLPMCDYTKKPCTYCVLGNATTYNQAKKYEREITNAKQ